MTIHIHHLNCGTLCPHCAHLVNGSGGWLRPGRLVCHVLLLETPRGLVLVDTGLGTDDVRSPQRLGRKFLRATRARLDPRETALAQLAARDVRADDVREICLTHLDRDHASGIGDFPKARVHVHEREYRAAVIGQAEQRTDRYIGSQWSAATQWQRHDAAGESWFGFQAVRALDPSEPDVLLIPLFGHTRGHCGIAVRSAEGWLLHAGDAYYHHLQLQSGPGRAPLGLRLFEWRAQEDAAQRRANLQRLRELAQLPDAPVRIINSHDPWHLPSAASA